MNFNPNPAGSAAAPSLNFGTSSATAPSSGFSFGVAQSTTQQTAGAPAQQLSFGAPTQQQQQQPLLQFGAASPAPNAAAPATGTTAAAPFTLGAKLSFGQPAAPAATAPTAAAAASAATAAAAAAPAAAAAAAPALSTVAPLMSNTLSLGGAPAANSATVAAKAAPPQASLSTGTTTTASANAPAAQLNFCQLEEHINKWTLALEEQEKTFMNQATQVNSWDKVLISNNNKIVTLSEAVEKVKIDQQALEQELEFIAAQHAELDECIAPLEQELTKTQHMDADKAQTYVLAENLDTQLRQMSEDLKEVIEHLNEANKVHDTSDPIVQIGLILNAHMSSLQWIESSTAQVLTKIDDIANIYDTLRRDNERSIRLTYD